MKGKEKFDTTKRSESTMGHMAFRRFNPWQGSHSLPCHGYFVYGHVPQSDASRRSWHLPSPLIFYSASSQMPFFFGGLECLELHLWFFLMDAKNIHLPKIKIVSPLIRREGICNLHTFRFFFWVIQNLGKLHVFFVIAFFFCTPPKKDPRK